MMTTDIEPVLAALFGALKDDPALADQIQIFSRRLEWWQDVSAQPALFLRHIFDEDAYDGTVCRTTVRCEIWLYCRASTDLSVAADSDLNRLVSLVRTVLSGDEEEGCFTLGGLAYWCRIEGESHYDSGDADQQCKAIIPVRILLP